MDVDTTTSATQVPLKHPVPELEIYCYLLVLIFLIDQKKYEEVIMLEMIISFDFFSETWKSLFLIHVVLSQAKACSSASVARLKHMNRRTVDVLASRLYFYYSYSYELTNNLAEIRG